MPRRIVALLLLVAVGASSFEVLLPGEPHAISSAAAVVLGDHSRPAAQEAGRADCACLCACGCTQAQAVVLADVLVPLGRYLTHAEAMQPPAQVVASRDPVRQFKPPRA